MSDIAFYPVTKLARMIRDGEISSGELLEIYIHRIEQYNDRLNAVVTLDLDRAQAQARQADEQKAKGKSLGPLHGVPVTIKDAFETKGLRTTSGASKLGDHIPKVHAIAVQRYVDAGAIVIGKTNVPLFCDDVQTYNDFFGITNNPWDLKRTPGGSSGGAAAALAAGFSGLELGSDIAGSIRIPASWTGIYGHKSSYGIIPQRGHIPPPPGIQAESDLEVIGPLSRSASDLMSALDVLIGPDPLISIGWTIQLPGPRASSLKEFRIAAWLDDDAMPVDDRVRDCLQSVLDALGAVGTKIDERARPEIDVAEAFQVYQRLMYPVMASGLPVRLFEEFEKARLAEPDGSEFDSFVRNVTITHREWLSANAKRQKYRRQWAEFFKHFDLLLCPVAGVSAIPHDTQVRQLERTIEINHRPVPYSMLQKWVGMITLAYLPATVAPVGLTSEGLPVGLQIVGPYLEDRTPILFAERLADIIGGFRVPPGFGSIPK